VNYRMQNYRKRRIFRYSIGTQLEDLFKIIGQPAAGGLPRYPV
jgi:hypothetical protein